MRPDATKSPPSLPEVGAIVGGKLRLDGVLGEGGGGVVFAATHLQLKQRVAIKVLRPKVMDALDGVARFVREAQAAAAIESEHCVRTMDFGTLPNGLPYIVMEYLDGMDLKRRLAADGPLATTEAVDVALQACEALSEAHRRGIVHRDLKPANLFLVARSDGSTRMKVLDFGIAKLLPAEGEESSGLTGDDVLGTAIYMAPEQLRHGSEVDARTDVWALGMTLHEMITGARPFPGGSSAAIAAAIVSDPPIALRDVSPSVPEGIERVVLKCLAKDPARRWSSIAELAAALEPFASIEGSLSAKRITATPARKRVAVRAAERPPIDDSTLGAAPSEMQPRPARESSRTWLAFVALGIAVAVVAFVVGRSRTPSVASAEPPPSAASSALSIVSASASSPTASAAVIARPPVLATAATSASNSVRPTATVKSTRPGDLVHDPSLLSRE